MKFSLFQLTINLFTQTFKFSNHTTFITHMMYNILKVYWRVRRVYYSDKSHFLSVPIGCYISVVFYLSNDVNKIMQLQQQNAETYSTLDKILQDNQSKTYDKSKILKFQHRPGVGLDQIGYFHQHLNLQRLEHKGLTQQLSVS